MFLLLLLVYCCLNKYNIMPNNLYQECQPFKVFFNNLSKGFNSEISIDCMKWIFYNFTDQIKWAQHCLFHFTISSSILYWYYYLFVFLFSFCHFLKHLLSFYLCLVCVHMMLVCKTIMPIKYFETVLHNGAKIKELLGDITSSSIAYTANMSWSLLWLVIASMHTKCLPISAHAILSYSLCSSNSDISNSDIGSAFIFSPPADATLHGSVQWK